MPGFPDKFMPFMDAAYPVRISANVARFSYGPLLRVMRRHSMKGGSRTPGWERPSGAVLTAAAPRWDIPGSRTGPDFQGYEVSGRPARRYSVGKSEQVRVELRQDRIVLAWSTPLDAQGWLETLHDFVGVKGNALGLIIPEAGSDIRGDLTWRETRAWLQQTGAQPRLVQIDVGSVSLLWISGTGSGKEAVVMSPSFDFDRFAQLMSASGTPDVRSVAAGILEDARLVRRWSREPKTGRESP